MPHYSTIILLVSLYLIRQINGLKIVDKHSKLKTLNIEINA